jgi:putative FmdB family regulatory protein
VRYWKSDFVKYEGECVPVYEYRCTKGHVFEVIQSMSEDAISKCEVCGRVAKRVLYAPAIHFKGTGFHNTDYGTKKRPRDGDKSDSGAKTDTSTSTSSDTSSSGGEGTAKVKEATPADTAKRATGP